MELIRKNDLVKAEEGIFINKVLEPVDQPQHIHDYLEIQFIVSGRGIHKVGNFEVEACAGDIFFTNCETPHCFLSSGETAPIVLYNCIFTPEFLEPAKIDYQKFNEMAGEILENWLFPSEMNRQPYLRLRDTGGEVGKIIEKMYTEYINKEQGYLEILLACVIQLLITLFRIYRTSHISEKMVRQKTYMGQIMAYIESHYEGEITLQQLSKIAFLSPNHLCKVFKEATGRTISEYVQKIRLENACRLLSETSKTIPAIAAEIGYKDESYLRKLFKKEKGVTPSQYRSIHSVK